MIARFSLLLLCGMSIMWCFMPRKLVTSGFFRLQMLVALGLSVLASLTVSQLEAGAILLPPAVVTTLCVLLAVLFWIGSVFWRLELRRPGERIVFVSTIIVLVIVGAMWDRTPPEGVPGVMNPVAAFSAGLLTGGLVTTMLLGHWYLTAPTMSLEPLERLTLYFGGAGVLRVLVATAALIQGWSQLGGQSHTLWLVLRWVAGLIGPLVICAMVLRILKYRNTQSATGVLFAGVVLVFIGELTAELLRRETGVPL